MSDTENHEFHGESEPRPVTETVSEQSPPHSNPPPVDPATTVPHGAEAETLGEKVEAFFAGWPKTFFHPVWGAQEFKDPNAHAAVGGTTGDYRFETAGEADAARTQTEAELVVLKRQQQTLADYEAQNPVIRSSVQAEESAKTGYPEPGISPGAAPAPSPAAGTLPETEPPEPAVSEPAPEPDHAA